MTDACYCHTLRRATRRMTALYDEALAPVGINLAQFSLLRKISRLQPVSFSDLGRESELDRSTIGRNVKVIERLELVQMVPLADQREAGVKLSDVGAATLARAMPLWEQVQVDIQAKLGVQNATQLEILLNAI